MSAIFASRRRNLRLMARLGGAAVAASAFSALAQDAASTAASIGTPSPQRQRFGAGPTMIALLVPPSNGAYRRAAAVLIDGVRAAHARDGAGITMEVIEVGESGMELRAVCVSLADRGFALAIGPLTRNAVTALAVGGPPEVPVLALNQTEEVAPPGNLIVFGLSIENEAAQAASYAFQGASVRQTERPPRAAIVHDGTPLSQRSIAAFIDRWYQSGGEYYEPIETAAVSSQGLATLLRGIEADVFFAAMPPASAAALRNAVGERGVIYGTSLLNSGAVPDAGEAVPFRSPELDGVRIVSMPWQVLLDHPAVMSYERPKALHVELQKLYALGIDAFRLGRQIVAGAARIDLDGVTGQLRLDLTRDPRVDRLPTLAVYRDGVLTAVGAP